MRWLILALLALGLPARGLAHEVRPAFLEIIERADGKLDVLWQQPSRGLMAVALRPRPAGGGLDGRVVQINGLERKITDTLRQVRFNSGDGRGAGAHPRQPRFCHQRA